MYKLKKTEKEHLKDLINLVKEYPNDQDLGSKIRNYFLNLRYDKRKDRKN
tara:strand:+ start:401 stop:550 length:150 start_codon:yes stop_codon:yes gene_type:complete